MREQLGRLRELQNIDLELDEFDKQKAEILGRLNEHKGFLQKLVDDLDAQKSEFEEIRALQRQKQADQRDTQEQHSKRKKRLQQVGSTKEYNAVEKEIEVLRKSLEQTEEEILHLGEVIENTELSISEKEEKVNQLRDSLAQDGKEADAQVAKFEGAVSALKARAKKARNEVSKRVMYKYDFIRTRRPGFAIVAAKDEHCEGCFMSIPAQLYNEIRRSDQIITCPSCQRILFFWEDAVEGAGESVAE